MSLKFRPFDKCKPHFTTISPCLMNCKFQIFAHLVYYVPYNLYIWYNILSLLSMPMVNVVYIFLKSVGFVLSEKCRVCIIKHSWNSNIRIFAKLFCSYPSLVTKICSFYFIHISITYILRCRIWVADMGIKATYRWKCPRYDIA